MKRPSVTKPPPKDPKDWVFFTDRDLGKAIPDALRADGRLVERHDDHFGPTTPDETWLPFVAKRGWIALSHNKKIRRVSLQRDIAMRAGLGLFFLVGKGHDDLARNLIATLPRIIRFRENHNPPFIANITRPKAKFPIGSRPGNVEMVLTKEQWLAMIDAE